MENLMKMFKANCDFLRSNDITGRTQRRELNKMLKDNSVVRLKRGLYRLSESDHADTFVELSNILPDGVFCMFSAWFHYNLTTTVPYENHIAIKQKRKVRLPDYPPIRLYYYNDEYYHLGIRQILIDNQQVNIYDLERSVCDAVRFRNKAGLEIALEVVKNYVKRKDRNLDKLMKYAVRLRIEKIMQNMIMPML
ncbi:MAG: hypothetical protein LBE56_01030 [Tannerella sp.]|jgi:predicted transcriptional regulator of viral defense system|nr:hypothetical protein [Tannerella sp.]